jgi:membrane protease YdiL (CAAX protease family)
MKLAVGFVLLLGVLQGVAAALSSTSGEWGLVVAACVFLAAWTVQRALHGEGFAAIGVRPESRGIGIAAALAAVLIAVAVVFLLARRAQVEITANWSWLALGMFAQGGLAEELVFRGYLFGHMRRTRSFWRAAMLSMAPFAAVHLFLFFTLDWPIALAALILSVALSFPYARLYELGMRTIWAPTLLHAVTQATPKLLVTDDNAFPLFWMAAGLVVSWSVFLLPVPSEDEESLRQRR